MSESDASANLSEDPEGSQSSEQSQIQTNKRGNRRRDYISKLTHKQNAKVNFTNDI